MARMPCWLAYYPILHSYHTLFSLREKQQKILSFKLPSAAFSEVFPFCIWWAFSRVGTNDHLFKNRNFSHQAPFEGAVSPRFSAISKSIEGVGVNGNSTYSCLTLLKRTVLVRKVLNWRGYRQVWKKWFKTWKRWADVFRFDSVTWKKATKNHHWWWFFHIWESEFYQWSMVWLV